ncbi:uncharacterized protein LOC113147273 [Cyclospora cayetanensis]|uniref:Uncharacterized protein LOC113147273 n=1 Tax=Cyclospora cayetanensis TaxID=88456 RepID=A0A6P6S0B8_9EIME|nr:uncharacterized protein LOC113147273 [Cyclospora cayetanensis]
MDALFSFLLQEETPGKAFDPRAARPRCKVCKADAWMQWDGRYADFCSYSCRDKYAVGKGLRQGSARPLREGGPTRRSREPRGPHELLGQRGAQLQQEKQEQWERQFSPRNRHLPKKTAQFQEEDPQQQQKDKAKEAAAAGAAGAFAEAAAAKKVAKALRDKVPRKLPKGGSVGPHTKEAGQASAEAAVVRTQSKNRRGGSTEEEEEPPLLKQRTVARFVEDSESAAEAQNALKEYQDNMKRLQQQHTGQHAAPVVAGECGLQQQPEGPGRQDTLLQQEREKKQEEEVRAFREQMELQRAHLEGELKRLAKKEADSQTTLEGGLREVHAALQALKAQHEEQRQQQAHGLRDELKQHLKEQLQQQLQHTLKQQLEEQLKHSLKQQLQQELLSTVAQDRKEASELLKRQLEQQQQQLQQEKLLQQQLLQQQQQQERLLRHLQKQQEKTLQQLSSAERQHADAGPGEASLVEQAFQDSQLRPLLVQGLLRHLKDQDNQKQEQEEVLLPSTWEQRELALRDAACAAAARATENPFSGVYDGHLEAAVLRANLLLPDAGAKQQPRLQFGTKLQVVLRCATGPSEWEERETALSADGIWKETFRFRVHWPSAAAAAAAAASVSAQLWATNSSRSSSNLHNGTNTRCFLGEAALPLPPFTSPWEHWSPLRWRSSLGGAGQQHLLQQGNILFRVQFHPSKTAAAAPPQELEDLQPLPRIAPAKTQSCKSGSRRRSTRSSTSSNSSSETTSHVKLTRDVSMGDEALQQQLLQQLDELSLAWRRAFTEQQQQLQQQHFPVCIDSDSLLEHLQRSPLMGALCTNAFCSNLVGPFSDLYTEEEFRVWGLCSTCQQRIFTTPLPQATHGSSLPRRRVRLESPLARCEADLGEMDVIEALAKTAASQHPHPFGELRLDGSAPVAFPTPNCLWPSALQLLHAQRFSLVSIQERLRCCSNSSELLALLQCPLLQRFERPDWPSRASSAVRTCLLLLLQQHPKLQLLLSTLDGCLITYHDPLQQQLLYRLLEQQQQQQGKPVRGRAPSEASSERLNRGSSLELNFAGSLLMDLCAALGPPFRR